MRNPGGCATWTGEQVVECDTFTCAHCNTVVFVPPRAAPAESGGFCRLCMKLICGPCSDHGCTPFEKKLEAMEAREAWRRAL